LASHRRAAMAHATIRPMHSHAGFARADRAHRRSRLGSILALLVVILGACGTSAPTGTPATSAGPSPSSVATPTSSAEATPVADPATIYASIEDQVIAIRGLHPKAKVDPHILDDAGIKKLIN